VGDLRFSRAYDRLRGARELPALPLKELGDDEVIQALAHASREHDPYLANVLATEALNRLAERRRWLDLVETFYHVHDGLGIGLVIVEEGRVFYANDAFRAMVGRTLDELARMATLLDLASPEDREAVQRDFGAAVRAGRTTAPTRLSLLRSEGGRVEVEVTVAPAPQASPEAPLRLVCVVRPLPLAEDR
jgi:PAS domain S-box-containing protein